MSGPKRNPDKLNTIGVVVVGICGAVLVYVSIVALQAFYLNDTSEIQTMADYGGNDVSARTIKTSQVQNITEYGANAAAPGKTPTYRTPIDIAMKNVIESAKADPAMLVPAAGRSDKSTVQPAFGRPTPMPAPATPPPAPADGAGAGSGSAAGSAAGAGSGSAVPAGGMVVPMTPTGGTGPGGSTPSSGSGSAAKGNGP